MNRHIPLSVPCFRGNEIAYVTQAIQEEWVSTAGKAIGNFEDQLSKYVKADYAVACQSGTAGIHLALLSQGIGKNDIVLVPTLTFVAAVNPVKYVNATPVFMDCDDSLTIDPYKLEEFCAKECHFTDGRLIHTKTGKSVRAVVVVHVFGNMADMESVMDVAKRYGIRVIEDATEALGTYYTSGKYAGRYAGTIGDVGVFSFNGNKIITTGGGGMIVTGNERIANECRHLSTQAKSDLLYFDHDEIGYNYRMTNLQAALGLAQLEQLEEFILQKENNYRRYVERDIELLPFRRDTRPNYWFYSYMAEDRDETMRLLAENEIQARPVWKLIHTLKPYRDELSYRIEKAVFYHDRILNLPCSAGLTEEELDRVVSVLKEEMAL
ncbi:MAG: LegC family aminotransferase [Lachnospiraceae bacterium]|nr:LegC family aminotransferase [Lachnospiraceae bacterium]